MPSVAGRIAVLMTLDSRPFASGLQQSTAPLEQLRATASRANISFGTLRSAMRVFNRAAISNISPQERFNTELAETRRLAAQINAAFAETQRGAFGVIPQPVQELITPEAIAGVEASLRQELFPEATSTLDRIINRLGVIRTVVIGIASARLFGAVESQITEAFNIENEVRRAQALFDAETDREFVREIGFTFGSDARFNTSIAEAIRGVNILRRDGLEIEQIFQRLPRILQLAEFAEIDFDQAVEISGDVFQALRLNVADANQELENFQFLIDLLVGSSNQADVTIPQISEFLLRSSPLLSSLSNDSRELTRELTAIGTAFAQIGRRDARAGEDASRVFRELTSFAVDNPIVANLLGINAFDDNGELVDAIAILEGAQGLLNSFGSDSEGLRDFIRNLGFEERALTGFVALAQQGSEARRQFNLQNGFTNVAEDISTDLLTDLGRATNSFQSFTEIFLNNTLVRNTERFAVAVNALSGSRLLRFIGSAAVGLVSFFALIRGGTIASAFLSTQFTILQSTLSGVATSASVGATRVAGFAGSMNLASASGARLSLSLRGIVSTLGILGAAAVAFSLFQSVEEAGNPIESRVRELQNNIEGASRLEEITRRATEAGIASTDGSRESAIADLETLLRNAELGISTPRFGLLNFGEFIPRAGLTEETAEAIRTAREAAGFDDLTQDTGLFGAFDEEASREFSVIQRTIDDLNRYRTAIDELTRSREEFRETGGALDVDERLLAGLFAESNARFDQQLENR